MNSNAPSSPALPEARPINATGDRAAYVIHVVSNLAHSNVQLVCPDLDPDLLDQLHDAAPTWRDGSDRRQYLWALIQSKAVPGLAVIDTGLTTKPFIPCRPIHVVFEPTSLDETHPNIVELAELSAGLEEVAPFRQRGWPLTRRYGARSVIMLSMAMFFAAYSFRAVINTRAITWDLYVWIGIALVITGIVQLVFWLMTNYWILIPGGVVVRRFWRGRGRKTLHHYTPSTAMLFLTEQGAGWNARICDQGKVLHDCQLTRLECIALLAAWQSPLPPPDVSKLVDLQ